VSAEVLPRERRRSHLVYRLVDVPSDCDSHSHHDVREHESLPLARSRIVEENEEERQKHRSQDDRHQEIEIYTTEQHERACWGGTYRQDVQAE
jgi:hypothetical protein